MGNITADAPTPKVLDLGNGEVACFGTAEEMRAAAEWLDRNYPDGPGDERFGPVFGPVLNMQIHHSRPGANFAIVPNETLRDERLSIAARGHLAYLLSLPDGWNTTADAESKRARQLRGRRGEGRDAMRRIYAELKDAGYIRYVRTQENGTWSTEIHVFDRPDTDARLTGVPETRMSVPPAEMPESDEYEPDVTGTFSQVAPTYGSPGVGNHVVGNHVVGNHVIPKKTELQKTKKKTRAVDGEAGDLGGPGVVPRHYEDDGQGQGQEQPLANSQKLRVHQGPGTVADEAQRFSLHDAESTTAGSYARASESNGSGQQPGETFEEYRQRQLDALTAWEREHQGGTVTP